MIKYHISIKFLTQKYHILYLQNLQNKNFAVIGKDVIPCSRKHHLIAFYLKPSHPLPHFLGYPSFVNAIERSSLYQLIELKKVFFLLPDNQNINFSFILKFISPSFLLNMNFPFVHVFIIISFFRRNSFLKTIL